MPVLLLCFALFFPLFVFKWTIDIHSISPLQNAAATEHICLCNSVCVRTYWVILTPGNKTSCLWCHTASSQRSRFKLVYPGILAQCFIISVGSKVLISDILFSVVSVAYTSSLLLFWFCTIFSSGTQGAPRWDFCWQLGEPFLTNKSVLVQPADVSLRELRLLF